MHTHYLQLTKCIYTNIFFCIINENKQKYLSSFYFITGLAFLCSTILFASFKMIYLSIYYETEAFFIVSIGSIVEYSCLLSEAFYSEWKYKTLV